MALGNLVENAVNYSAPGTRVACGVRRNGEIVEVSVSDQGIGIPEPDLERIFERFYRLDDPYLRHLAGAGLGLYIARELARRHGGDVVLESSGENAGSRFTLTLPSPRPSP
jgi:two-component system sensor histidine kinase SenX3